MVIYLISGVKGSGKDTFFSNPEKFIVCSPSGDGIIIPSGKRLAFADEVKREMNIDINIERKEKEKIRDEIINFAQSKKKEDPFYWARKVSLQISEGEDVVITDWRFPEELEFLKREKKDKILTYRINPGWKFSDFSESRLDDFEFDYLVSWKVGGVEEVEEKVED